MVVLSNSLHAWRSEAFAKTLKAELEGLGRDKLPLDKAVSQGGLVDDSDVSVVVLKSREECRRICTHVGVFFSEIVGGCSCGDDLLVQNAYCELNIYIDTVTANAEFALDLHQ